MASSNLPPRIIKETQRLLSEPAPGISASPSEENMRYFNVMILGPAQSPYEGSLLVDVFLWMFSTQINLVQHLLVFLCAYLGFLTSVEVGLYWEALPP
ncbi:hypothetical protein GW17_00032047 [Ensete ventricosum]|nr:hypothetical protein GW17_00032047 [Ensete ventricosum]